MNWRTITVLMLIGGTALLLTAGVGQGQIELARPKGELSKEQAQQLSMLRQKLSTHAYTGEFADSLRLAREMLHLHEKWQGKSHWQVVEARWDVERWQRLADLPAEKQKALAPAFESLRNAITASSSRKYVDAEQAYRKSLEICKTIVGEKHSETASFYTLASSMLDMQGKYSQAQLLYQKALDICREVHGEKHPDTAAGYNNVAYTLIHQGKHAQAEPFLQKSLDIWRELHGEKHPHTAAGYNNMASNLHLQGKFSQAQPVLQKSLDIYRQLLGENDPDTARAYQNVASNLSNQGKHAQAQPLFQKALDIRREVHGEKHRDTAISYNAMAGNLAAQRKHAQAQPFNQKSLDIFREVLGEKHPYTAHSYSDVASNLGALGKHAQAQPLFQKALDIRREVLGEKHRDTATSYNLAAGNLDDQGKPEQAQPLYQKALDIRREVHGEKHPATAESYNNVASYLGAQGESVQALPLNEKALDIWRELLGERHPRTAFSYRNLAYNLVRLNKYPEAEKALRAGLLAYDIARVDRATSGFERSLAAKLSPRPLLAVLLARRGAVLEAWQYAEANLARGLLDDLGPRSGQGGEDAKTMLALLHKFDERLVPLLTAAKLEPYQLEVRDDLLHQRTELIDELSDFAVRQSAEHVLPFKAIQAQIPLDTALVFWIETANNVWACVVTREGLPGWQGLPGSGKDRAWTKEDREIHLKLYDALESPSKTTDAERAKLTATFLKLRFEPLQKHLKAEGKLPAVRKLLVVPTGAMARIPLESLNTGYTISYVPSGSVYARLAEKHRPLQASSLLALGDPIFAAPPVKQDPAPAQGLFLQTILPGGAAAKAGLQAGDVLLRYNDLPLKTLADLKLVEDGAPVKTVIWRDGIEKTIRVSPGKLGVAIDKRPAPDAVAAWRNDKALMTSLRSTGHQRLPASRFEVQALTKLVGEKQSTLLVGSDASEQALDNLGKAGLKKFRLVHFATHGDVDMIDPYRSALILAQDDLPDGLESFRKGKKVYNGRLTVETILRHWHLDADLVVLSACQTGLGKSAEGEGLLGFAQAFLQKGARSVLLSRWKVDDTATALLMVRFYENALGKRKDLKTPMGRAEALDEARVWLRTLSRTDAERLSVGLTGGVLRGTERDELPPVKAGAANLPAGERPFAHPFYWASFVLIGDPN